MINNHAQPPPMNEYAKEIPDISRRLHHAADLCTWDIAPSTQDDAFGVSMNVELAARQAQDASNRLLQIAEGIRIKAQLLDSSSESLEE